MELVRTISVRGVPQWWFDLVNARLLEAAVMRGVRVDVSEPPNDSRRYAGPFGRDIVCNESAADLLVKDFAEWLEKAKPSDIYTPQAVSSMQDDAILVMWMCRAKVSK